MPEATADRIRVSYAEETTFGTAPTSGNYKDLRLTSESLEQASASEQSKEIRSDRQVVDVIRTGISVGGNLNFELSYGALDDLLAAALFASAWSSEVDLSPGTTVTITGATGQIVDDGSGNAFANAVVGQWIKISSTTNNNGIYKILTKSDNNTITVAGESAMTDEATVAAVIKMGAQIVNGVSLSSFTFQKEFTDLTNEWERNLGCVLDTFSLSLAQDQIITGAFGVMGKKQESATANAGTGYDAAPTNDVMQCIDHVLTVIEGTPAVNQSNDFQALSLSLALTNNTRLRNVIGTLGAISAGAGKVQITGTLTAYFSAKTVLDKYLNWTSSAVAIIAQDAAGNAYVFELPDVKFTAGQRVAGGENTDIIAEMGITARRDSSEDAMIRIVRFPTS